MEIVIHGIMPPYIGAPSCTSAWPGQSAYKENAKIKDKTSSMHNPNTERLFRALADVPTPALVIDEETLERNITAMAEFAKRAARSLRPHAKTHKCVEIARKQIEAGAIGICCATLPELQAMAEARIGGLLLTAPVQDSAKTESLIAIAKATPITIAVDHPSQIDALVAQLPSDATVSILVDVDVGQKRTGVCDVQATLAIAKLAAGDKRINFKGVQGYAGHVQHIPDFAERAREAARVSARLGEHIAGLRENGFDLAIVSGGGTGTHAIDLTQQPFTEIQAGSYVFMDADYARIQSKNGEGLPFQCSLLMLTTVTSANRQGQVTVDAGTKSLAVNGPAPHLIVGAPEGTTFGFAGDEHGILSLPAGSNFPKLGDRILMSVTHCDPTVNLFSVMHAVKASGEIEKWQTVGRN
jgi:D-serine deaminase-like pyridoxal phosphate-dependent protein